MSTRGNNNGKDNVNMVNRAATIFNSLIVQMINWKMFSQQENHAMK